MSKFTHLEEKLRYSFRQSRLLCQALTHRSCSSDNYERLEFVGDSILDYVIAINLYNKYPQLSEGELSKARARIVNQDSLVNVANSLDLGKYLLLGGGESKSGGRERPSILADSLEAIIAAITLDSSLVEAIVVVEQLFADAINDLQLDITDSKSHLQEYLQSKQYGLPVYELANVSGPVHDSVFTIKCVIDALAIKVEAVGKSKKEASQLAAAAALKLIKKSQ